ncbi:DNA-3-methyladenine glycosylase 2 family protein [Natronosporangium hydrolyticum]|uniref:DNA-3-methyladenine glycosylase II n=1 Tax=Natronosporangium hydrolyticum TaxID=2811111 RepID=A0A895YCB1_9ACTN|nr:AlkA N-terminal domain-containing protein [Natronosporangium hydrolyticum]QSB13875.1 DNA-3-methyladenine glycosylase 2 family protein [Natronosporangium hydrolyticum]
MELEFEWCYRAVSSRDRRFDGWFVTAVTTTRIYCRPSCPARTPQPGNVRFYRSAAAAHGAGFRACRRCLPDAVPGSPEWDQRADTVGRAMRLISDGEVDRAGVPGLAHRLGYTERHLHRLLTAEVGAGPLALARAQRAQAARVLVETTQLSLGEIAFAAGFGSVRQFNDTIKLVYGVSPTQLRPARQRPGSASGEIIAAADPVEAASGITVRLAYRSPLHAPALLAFLGARTIPGVEQWQAETYQRALRLPHGPATVALGPANGHIVAQLWLTDVRDLAPAVARCRRLLDLDADPEAVDSALRNDPGLRDAVAAEPGVRVPRAVDGFELAVRAIVGQQISVAAARTVLGRLVAAARPPSADHARLAPFPDPATLRKLPDSAFGMPTRRRETLRALATAVDTGDLSLDPDADRAATVAALRDLPGVGDWTIDYLRLRLFGEPDVFLATDLAARRAARALGLPDEVSPLAAYAADHWAPWRSYALMRLWRLA